MLLKPRCGPDGLCESQMRKQINTKAFLIIPAEDITVGNVEMKKEVSLTDLEFSDELAVFLFQHEQAGYRSSVFVGFFESLTLS